MKGKHVNTKLAFSIFSASVLLTGLPAQSILAEPMNTAPQDLKNAEAYDTDNSGQNMRDRARSRLTADDQAKQTSEDLTVLSKIRDQVTSNPGLSTYAKNIKIIALGGRVTLRGPVKDIKETQVIEETVKRVAPNYEVINQLEVVRR